MTRATSSKLRARWQAIVKKLRGRPWIVIIIVSGVVVLAPMIYQACTPARESQFQDHKGFQIIDISAGITHTLTLTITYPTLLPLDNPDKPGRPISVWLTDQQPASPPSTYTVRLEPLSDGLLFTDGDGVPAVPQAVLVAKSVPDDPGAWLVCRAPLTNTQGIPGTIKITPKVYNSGGAELKVTELSGPVQVHLETGFEAFRRHFADVFFGPTTPLLGLIGILFGLALQQFQQEQQRRQTQQQQQEQERRQRELRQRMNQIADLDSAWQSDRAKAVQSYLQLQEAARQATDDEAIERLERMWNQGWRERVLDVAVEGLVRGQDDLARQAAEAVADKDITETSCGNGSTSDKQSDARCILTILSERPPLEKIGSIMALAASRGPMLKERLVLLLKTALGEGDARQVFLSMRQINPRHVWLVRTPEIQEQLKSIKTPENEESVNSLLMLGKMPFEWSKLWPAGCLKDEEVIVKVLSRLGWARNPFGPERAEDDPRSPELFSLIEPPLWSQLTVMKPTLLSSAPGCGQTAALWWLVDRWCAGQSGAQEDSAAEPFPVLLDSRGLLVARTRNGCLGELSWALARSLLDFLTFNPDAFDESPPRHRRAIARLVAAHQGRLGEPLQELQAIGLADPTMARLARAIADAGTGTRPLVARDEADLLFTLAEARLAGFRGCVLAADISSRYLQPCGPYDPEGLAARIRPLVALMPDLAINNVILKVGVPKPAADHLKGSKVSLEPWSEKLLASMLAERVHWAGGSKQDPLRPLFDRTVASGVPERELVQKARGSPQRLVWLGNALLARLGSKEEGELLSAQDLTDVIAEVEGIDAGP